MCLGISLIPAHVSLCCGQHIVMCLGNSLAPTVVSLVVVEGKWWCARALAWLLPAPLLSWWAVYNALNLGWMDLSPALMLWHMLRLHSFGSITVLPYVPSFKATFQLLMCTLSALFPLCVLCLTSLRAKATHE